MPVPCIRPWDIVHGGCIVNINIITPNYYFSGPRVRTVADPARSYIIIIITTIRVDGGGRGGRSVQVNPVNRTDGTAVEVGTKCTRRRQRGRTVGPRAAVSIPWVDGTRSCHFPGNTSPAGSPPSTCTSAGTGRSAWAAAGCTAGTGSSTAGLRTRFRWVQWRYPVPVSVLWGGYGSSPEFAGIF